MYKYDYLIIGSGITGAAFAHEAAARGKRCLVLEKRSHIGGNVYDVERDGILLHRYGAHIFHTSDRNVWEFVNRFCEFRPFINSPVANYRGELYNLPFNMNTFCKLWSVTTPEEVRQKIDEERMEIGREPGNLEEQALSLVGTTIYEKLIRGYTEKQWGRSCQELPPEIIKRIPLRFTFDNNYFNDIYQGIPAGGYTELIRLMLKGCEVRTEADYFSDKKTFDSLAEKVFYTGMIDQYFGFCFGALEYRSLRFEDSVYETENYQGVAVMNYTDRETPHTRSIEHKHFLTPDTPYTIVTREYPEEWSLGKEPYYPVNDEKNQELYNRYLKLAERETKVMFCGRLAQYRYCNMDQAIATALKAAERELCDN